DSPMVNAFAIPGGFVYVARGLLAELNSESELAGILGHEIAHITQRHALKKENRAKALQALSAVAEIATMTPGVYDVGNLASQGIIEGYSRDVELEADRIGAKYMAKAGYDPAAMMKTIDTLKAQERLDIKEARLEDRELDPTSFGWLASHPDNDTRYRQAIKQAHALEATYHEFIKSDEFLEKLNGLAYGPTHQVGVVRKDNFYDPRVGIKLAFPEGWHVESNPSGVQMVSAKRDAVLALSTGQYMAGVDGRQYVGKMGVKIRNGRDVNIGGMPGFIGIADHVQTPFGPRPVRLAVLFDTMRHITFIMTGAGKHDLHDIANDRDFIATIFSFGRMDRHDFEVAVRPRIQVVRAEKGTTMEALAKQSPISNYALDKLRLMNGMYPDGEPKPGQLIKIID
ncbi:MAG TPA: M48 family metalloprotease, partial [Pseudomonadales bacterium]|nr:M48 family metalloprotease [Pseudomonadales bacterium]